MPNFFTPHSFHKIRPCILAFFFVFCLFKINTGTLFELKNYNNYETSTRYFAQHHRVIVYQCFKQASLQNKCISRVDRCRIYFTFKRIFRDSLTPRPRIRNYVKLFIPIDTNASHPGVFNFKAIYRSHGCRINYRPD